jgi:hypothetical protein
MTHRIDLFAAICLLSGCTTGPWKDFYGDQQSADVPQNVRSFVIDAQGCAHFSGEEPYDSERALFLKKNMDKMCANLPQKRQRLLDQYQDNNEARKLIADAWISFEE